MAEPFDDTALFPVILTPEIFECLACFFGCLPELLVVFPNERYRFGSTFFLLFSLSLPPSCVLQKIKNYI